MRKVQVYIEGERLELFQDETISLNSSVQNVNDISKVFTDFTQSFTIPASPHNNQIFQHFYASEVDGTIDHRIRRDARIEIDLIPFKTGTIQIEKSNLKKGQVESYTITFYGDIRTLQDYFADDKLASLDMTPYTHDYNGAEVKTRITSSSNYDIRYPLITSDRVWTYGDNTSTDISKNSDHIHYTELFPAIRINRIFEAIETKYGIDFQGLFLSDKRFTNCFLWLKNKADYNSYSLEKKFDIYESYFFEDEPSTVSNPYDTGSDSISINFNSFYGSPQFNNFAIEHDLNVYFIVDFAYATLCQVYVDVYKNGSLFTTLTNLDSSGVLQNEFEFNYEVENEQGLSDVFYFVGRSTDDAAIYMGSTYYLYLYGAGSQSQILAEGGANQNTFQLLYFIGEVDVQNNMPDMKISDFVSGVLKQFNLTCYGLNATTFQIEPLDDWYGRGRIIDVTKHIDIENVDIERIKLYKNVSFEHEVSQSFTNVTFYDNFKRQYGDLSQSYEYDGGDYVIKVPFENLLHTKFTNTNLQVAYSLDKDFAPYIPKPILLYMNEQKSCSFYFNDGSTTTEITTYMPFGQDLIYNGGNYSLNFGWDNSTMLNQPVNNNIYYVYYNGYLGNLYAPKNRLYYYKGLFPTAILTSLKLNDRLIIRDKRYIINELKTNLNTGEVDLVLLLDFRPIKNNFKQKPVQNLTGELTMPIIVKNKSVEVIIDTGKSGVTSNYKSVSTDTNVTFTLPLLPYDTFDTEDGFDLVAENGDKLIGEEVYLVATEHYVIIAENDDIIYTETYQQIRDEENNDVTYEVILTHVYEDGTTEEEIILLVGKT